MARADLETRALSDVLADEIGGRKVRAAVFTTFTFDPGFFELHVLPILFPDRSFWHGDKGKLIQLSDALKGLQGVAVYYDRRGLSQDALPAQLNFERIDVRRKTGCFHPKLVLILVDNPPEEEGEPQLQSLIVGTLSANLTRSGWWENVEVAHFEEIHDRRATGERCSFRQDLMPLLLAVERSSREPRDHAALGIVRDFLRHQVSTEPLRRRSSRGRLFTRVFFGQDQLAKWLEAELLLSRRDYNLEIVTPFFDKEDKGTLRRLIDATRPKEVRIFLPCDAEGAPKVSKETYDHVAELARWSKLPENLVQRSGGSRQAGLAPRGVHAKVYRFWRRGQGAVVVVGSANLTEPGHSQAKAGNFEAAFVVHLEQDCGWWLKPIDAEPEAFPSVEEAEDNDVEPTLVDICFRFDWRTRELAYWLDTAVEGGFQVREPAGSDLFSIRKPVVGEWCPCGGEASAAVAKLLAATSFLLVVHPKGEWRVLVREEGMGHKPSLEERLTAEEILLYWSLFSPTQRQAFILERLWSDAEVEGLQAGGGRQSSTGDTMFARFAGIFHAFAALRKRVDTALEEDRPTEAETWLYGAQCDSLPTLLDKATEPDESDPVLAYLVLLCAKQLRHHVNAGAQGVLSREPCRGCTPRRTLGASRAGARYPGSRRRRRGAVSRLVRTELRTHDRAARGGRRVKTISVECAGRLIDFAPSMEQRGREFARDQLHGSVAVHNMLARNRVTYLADEVGMGKTYVALGAMALLRHFHPRARIIVIAPRQNIQRKWVKEYRNFVEDNWKVKDNAVCAIQGGPDRPLVHCESLYEMAKVLSETMQRDLFLRMTSFSPALRSRESKEHVRDRLHKALPRLPRQILHPGLPYDTFRDRYGQILNTLVPDIDLLVVDEAHNLKHGLRRSSATRNHLLAQIFGHPSVEAPEFPEYRPKVKRLLLLSATPFEYDFADLWNQLDVFGFGQRRLVDEDGQDPLSVAGLTQRDSDEDDVRKSQIAERLLIRRISGMQINGELHTKNMYRREWRRGGFTDHDDPIVIEDPRERLIVALVQKKVVEVVGSEKFNNHFQIGMLSSFESFVETATRRRASLSEAENDNGDGAERVFDGQQEATALQRRGADSHSLTSIVRSYKREFGGQSLPHPKLDATVDALTSTFEDGIKSLIFVRRLATMGEMAERNLSTTMGHSTGLIREQCPVWWGKGWED